MSFDGQRVLLVGQEQSVEGLDGPVGLARLSQATIAPR